MNSADQIGYIFQAEIICPDCIISRLEDAGLASVNAKEVAEKYGVDTTLEFIASVNGWDFRDESTYDSDVFPKVVLVQMVEDDYQAVRCGSCANLLFDDEDEYYPPCDVCGEPIDYCQGHGDHSGSDDGFDAGYAVVEVLAAYVVAILVMVLSGIVRGWDDVWVILLFAWPIMWAFTR